MKYKVGDKVKIHSFEFFEKNLPYLNHSGSFVTPNNLHIVRSMLRYCDQIMTIEYVGKNFYNLEDMFFDWDDYCFEEVPTERTKFTFIDFDVIIL